MDLHVITGDDDHKMGSQGLDQFAAARVKLDELFIYWLTLPDTKSLFSGLLSDLHAGKSVAIPSGSLTHSLLAKQQAGATLPNSPLRGKNSPPPRSPSAAKSPPNGPPATSPNPHFTFEPVDDRHSPVQAEHDSPSGPRSPGFSPSADRTAPAKVLFAAGQKEAAKPPPPVASPTKRSSPSLASPPPLTSPPGKIPNIPRFFVPGMGGRGRGKRIETETLEQKLNLVVEVFRAAKAARPANVVTTPDALEGLPKTTPMETASDVSLPVNDLSIALTVEQFPAVAKTLCGFPSFFAAPLFRRIKKLYNMYDTAAAENKDGAAETKQEPMSLEEEDKGEITLKQFLVYWRDEMEPYDHTERFFRLTKQPEAAAMVKSDFLPLMEELLAFHPGLAFLEGTPEFQEKYARTVIARIFYMLDPLNRGNIPERALRRSNLINAFLHVDMEEDINLVNEYFSYEHFYVLYCKFWELDTDHDFLLSREDLTPFGNHSLTTPILDRVFAQAGRPFECKQPNKMGYEDFICFLLSEEDKTHEVSLAYWFRVIDLDGDGVIRTFEMRHFYKDQMQRMEDMNCEVVPFDDVLCQMSDLLTPDVEGEFRLTDFYKPDRIRLTGVFFSILSNLNKFTAFEQRDPFVVKQQQEPGFTAWDRYAQIEYARLAMEEDPQEDDNFQLDALDAGGEVGTWDDDDDGRSAEAPF